MIGSMIDAAGLRVIRAIAEEGSFTAAATSLGYSQPAISQMVRRMEDRIGTVLVERLGRSVRLTQAGAVLARHAGPILKALETAESEVAAIAGLRAGRVRLMAFPSSSSTLVPHALAMVRREFPDIEVTFTEAEPPESLAALRSGDCDIAVAFAYDGTTPARGEDDIAQFQSRTLLDDEVRLVVPADHRLAGMTSVGMADLVDEEWIAGCPRCRGHLLALAEHAGFSPSVSYETEDYVAVLGFVAAGLGVALVPDLILASAHNDGVSVVAIEPAPRRTVYAVTTPDLTRVPAVAATLRALCSAATAVQRTTPTV